ncbi:threonine--tRNA ligase [Candidatus Micrarchaeota archaeon]|nr:threonine--tRNA ligase [Candidatus Micrarchaeota archaeon]
MRILELHCDYFSYKTEKKALKSVADIKEEEKAGRVENVLVVFTSIEEGDTAEVAKKAALEIRKNFLEVKAKTILLHPYAHLSSKLARPAEAVYMLGELYLEIKNFAPDAHKSPFGYYKSFEMRCKGHPLAELSKTITSENLERTLEKAGKDAVLEVSLSKSQAEADVVSQSLATESKMKSHFHILDLDGKLHDIQNFNFGSFGGLAEFAEYETKKVRSYSEEPPHIKIMKEQALVDYEPASDSGHFSWRPKGALMKKLLEKAITDIVVDYGAMQVETPIMYDFEHPALKKYLNRFPARQYVVKSDNKEFFLRFAACFGQFIMAHSLTISHRHLPLKIYELTHYSFRREQSGELAGLKRLRAFSMPDMHTLCRDFESAKNEFESQFHKCRQWNEDMEIPFETAFRVQEDFFNENKEWYSKFAKSLGKPILLELFKERYAYFITKFEMNFIDNARKASGLSTVQIDVENSETFDIAFTDEDGKKKRPLILHASIPGAIERVIYALLELNAMKMKEGKTPMFPVWLSPTQIRIVPLSEKQNKFCEKLLKDLKQMGIRADFDDRQETMQKKVRDAEKEWIPYVAVVGDKEEASGNLSVRIRKNGNNAQLSVSEIAQLIKNESLNRPFEKLPLQDKLSLRPIF